MLLRLNGKANMSENTNLGVYMRLLLAVVLSAIPFTAIASPFDQFAGNYVFTSEVLVEKVGTEHCPVAFYELEVATKIGVEIADPEEVLFSHIVRIHYNEWGDGFPYTISRDGTYRDPYDLEKIVHTVRTTGGPGEVLYEQVVYKEKTSRYTANMAKEDDIYKFTIMYELFEGEELVESCLNSVEMQKEN